MAKSIRQDLGVRIGLVILLVSLAIGAAYYGYAMGQHRQAFRDFVEQHTSHIADTFTLQLWLFDLHTTRQLCQIFAEDPTVAGLLLRDHNNEVIFQKEAAGNRENTLTMRRELRYGGDKLVGYLEIIYANLGWREQRKNMLLVGILMAAGAILGSLLVIDILLKRYLSRPLANLRNDMALLAQGDFPQSRLVNQKAEIQKIIDAFNRLTRSLQERDEALSEATRIINRSPAVAFLWKNDAQWSVEFVSENVVKLAGYASHDFLAGKISYGAIIHPQDKARVVEEVAKAGMEAGLVTFTHKPYRIISKDGVVKWVRDQSYIRRDSQGVITHFEGIVVDVTEEIELEERLQQAQKMEAVGTLAGGIAHDFNNILSVILGYSELAKDDALPGSDIAQDLEQVIIAGNRAKELVKQILAFSRQAKVERIPLQLQSLIKEALKMLRSSIPTTIEIKDEIDSRCGPVLVDPTQVHQILMNLCTNANHAMEKSGGVLTIELNPALVGPAHHPSAANLKPGKYTELVVSDTGSGIAPEVMPKIFNPYFTTKNVGKGTGMGLAITHGIVAGYGGAITVASEVGQGSAFHVYLPVVEPQAMEDGQGGQNAEVLPMGQEHILFVDDEELLAQMGHDMLSRLGYRVTACGSSLEALATFQRSPGDFDLVITDQTMPDMTGLDLARRMLQIRPDIPIILCTGYSNLVDEKKAKSVGIREFVLKPLTKGMVATLIRQALGDKGKEGGGGERLGPI
jgi:PAS domain S-box-containing protein